ncbi:DNA-protecting protein DprA [Candidatus Peregrinibacteria bacterium]|nr:MAG: DNA-protecting protein DprA [Candidatus Peregrinibacteria bacterium]
MNAYMAAWAQSEWMTYIRYQKIMAVFGSLEDAWRAIPQYSPEMLFETGESIKRIKKFFVEISPDDEEAFLKKHNISLLFLDDDAYPFLLKQISSPPVFLYFQGDMSRYEKMLAVVGTRKITSYGKRFIDRIIPELFPFFTIVSGLAFGVDSYTQNVCVQKHQRTVAVLGSGLLRIYPSSHISLAKKIIEAGGAIISEFPPKKEAQTYHFPRRNRIISGLSSGVIIVEAALKSGSLITAKYAIEQNREVFSVPGNIFSSESAGTNLLIQKGEAKAIINAEDILNEFSLSLKNNKKEVQKEIIFPSSESKKVYGALSVEGSSVDALSEVTGLSSGCIQSALTILEMQYLVKNIGAGIWIKNM